MHDALQAPAPAERRPRGRRVRAMLAGGLVLGVGAAITLAAWSDSEFAAGTFQSGQFDLQGSTDGADGTYANHASATTALGGAAPLAFSSRFDDLAPGDTVHAGYWVRLAEGTTRDAQLRLTSIDATGGAQRDASASLSWTATAIPAAASCGAEAVAAGTPLQSGASLADRAFDGGPALSLVRGADATTAGAAQQICFTVTAADSLQQGATASAVWQLAADSE